MPRLRPDLESLRPYRPGRSAGDVAAEFGVEDPVKIASNEIPDPPFPEVIEAITAAAAGVNRYPDNSRRALRTALSSHLGVDPDRIWAGGASNEIGTLVAIAFGGPGTSIVYPWPSFGLYPIATRTAGSRAIEIPLTGDHRVDLDAMASAIDSTTSVVYVCNPNNPTGTHVPFDRVEAFIASMPDDVLVLVDEAYHEFATAEDHGSAIHLAAERSNVAVTRTFSKIYGLAGLRLGYIVAAPAILDGIRRIQIPFTVTELASAAAVEALRHQDQVAERVARIAAGRARLTGGLRDRGHEVADSETNFVYAHFGPNAEQVLEGLLRLGVIVRESIPTGWLRISVGTEREIDRFFEALDRL